MEIYCPGSFVSTWCLVLFSGLYWIGVLFLGFCFPYEFSESMMAVYFLFYWLAQLMCSQVMPSGVGGWDTETSGGREVRRQWSVWATGDVCGTGWIGGRGGRLQLFFSYSPRNETGGLDLGEQSVLFNIILFLIYFLFQFFIVIFIVFLIFFEREREITWNWVGREVDRIWVKSGEGKEYMIKTYCIKFILIKIKNEYKISAKHLSPELECYKISTLKIEDAWSISHLCSYALVYSSTCISIVFSLIFYTMYFDYILFSPKFSQINYTSLPILLLVSSFSQKEQNKTKTKPPKLKIKTNNS